MYYSRKEFSNVVLVPPTAVSLYIKASLLFCYWPITVSAHQFISFIAFYKEKILKLWLEWQLKVLCILPYLHPSFVHSAPLHAQHLYYFFASATSFAFSADRQSLQHTQPNYYIMRSIQLLCRARVCIIAYLAIIVSTVFGISLGIICFCTTSSPVASSFSIAFAFNYSVPCFSLTLWFLVTWYIPSVSIWIALVSSQLRLKSCEGVHSGTPPSFYIALVQKPVNSGSLSQVLIVIPHPRWWHLTVGICATFDLSLGLDWKLLMEVSEEH